QQDALGCQCHQLGGQRRPAFRRVGALPDPLLRLPADHQHVLAHINAHIAAHDRLLRDKLHLESTLAGPTLVAVRARDPGTCSGFMARARRAAARAPTRAYGHSGLSACRTPLSPDKVTRPKDTSGFSRDPSRRISRRSGFSRDCWTGIAAKAAPTAAPTASR